MVNKLAKNRTIAILKSVNFDDKTVLELGCCGMGKYDIYTSKHWFHRSIAKRAKKVIGMDKNKKMISVLKEQGYDIREQDLNKSFDLNKTFDIITANEILEHLVEPFNCLINIKKHLKKNGLLIITTPHVWSHFYFLQFLLLNNIKGVSLEDHKFWWDKDTLTNLLIEAGFKVKKVDYVYPDHSAHPIMDWLIFKPIMFLLPKRMGRNLLIICEKQ